MTFLTTSRSYGLIVLAFILASPTVATAVDFVSAQNVSNSDSAHEVAEPVSIVQSYGGVDWYFTAYMRFNHPQNSSVQLYATETFNPAIPWPQAQALPNSLANSGDPVLVETQGDGGNVYLFGTSWNGGQDSFDPSSPTCTLANGIMAWLFTTNGAQWIRTPVHQNAVHSGYFDDKPTAIVSQASRNPPGLVYVAFNRARVDTTNACSQPDADGDGIHVYSYLNGTATRLSVVPGTQSRTDAKIGAPVLFEDPWGPWLYIAWIETGSGGGKIRVKASQDGISWIDPSLVDATLSEPALLTGSNLDMVCDDNRVTCVNVSSTGLNVARWPFGGGIYGLVYTRRKANTPAGAEAMFVRFWPANNPHFSCPIPVTWQSAPDSTCGQTAADDHYTWNPMIVADSSGNFVMTYYDYNHQELPSRLRYRLSGAKFTADGTPILGAAKVLFDGSQPTCLGDDGTTVCSELRHGPNFPDDYPYANPQLFQTNGANLGEYQGLFLWKGVLQAATVYIRSGAVGDIYFVRGTP